ncbi:hypothetical protein RUMLAC_02638 [[Ruminococcus] lactaris ATCC 29176]|uniref:Uncharacterized protein n=1 Tax=[Ruminococcus] lactaris ATCC 29176 TaxID=471875 RepID=B5CT16_9FIRM|nr:hypothetical protein RUMLAC_02638 [[Ruminococcus] lactaris ATCC 29176]
MVEKDFCRYSDMPSLLVVTMVATIIFFAYFVLHKIVKYA